MKNILSMFQTLRKKIDVWEEKQERWRDLLFFGTVPTVALILFFVFLIDYAPIKNASPWVGVGIYFIVEFILGCLIFSKNPGVPTITGLLIAFLAIPDHALAMVAIPRKATLSDFKLIEEPQKSLEDSLPSPQRAIVGIEIDPDGSTKIRSIRYLSKNETLGTLEVVSNPSITMTEREVRQLLTENGVTVYEVYGTYGGGSGTTGTGDREPKLIWVVCGIVVLAVGAVVVYQLCKTAKKLNPPAPSPPVCPPCPPSSNCFQFTNWWYTNWYYTNWVATNAGPVELAAWPTQSSGVSTFTNPIALCCNVELTGSMEMDTHNSTNPVPYTQLMIGMFPGFQRSIDLVHWGEYPVTFMMRLSFNGADLVLSSQGRQVYQTYLPRSSNGQYGSGTSIPFVFWIEPDSPQLFFRCVPVE